MQLFPKVAYKAKKLIYVALSSLPMQARAYHPNQERGLVGRLMHDLADAGITARDRTITYAGRAARSIKTPAYAVVIAGGITAAMLGISGAGKTYAGPGCTGTYVTSSDNVGNGGMGPPDNDMNVMLRNLYVNHPGEFKINSDLIELQIDSNDGNGEDAILIYCGSLTINQSSAELKIGANGVNMSVSDKIFVNGHYEGDLSGSDGSDSVSTFTVPGSHLVQPVGGIASLSDVGRYPQMADNDSNRFGAREGAMAGGAAAAGVLALGGAGLYYSKRRQH